MIVVFVLSEALTNVPPEFRIWKVFKIPALLINAYDVIVRKHFLKKIKEKGGLHSFLDFDGLIFVDSGGFQIMRYGLKISLDQIIEVYKVLKADYYFSLDYPCPFVKNAEKKVLDTVCNFIKLHKHFANVIPIIHYPLTRGLRQLEIYKEFDIDYFAVGGIALLKHRKPEKIISFLKTVRKKLEGKKLHVLGVGSIPWLKIVTSLNYDSADSASWMIHGAYGKIIFPNGKVYRCSNRYPNFPENEKQVEILKEINHPVLEKYGWEGIRNNYYVRLLFNAWSIQYAVTAL